MTASSRLAAAVSDPDPFARLNELRRLRVAVQRAYDKERERLASETTAREVRRWANENGYSIAATGKVPGSVTQAYRFARSVGAA